MKIGKTKLSQKILIVFLTILLSFNFINPLVVKADDDDDGGILAEPIMNFVNYIGDSIMNIMQKIFIGHSNAVYKEVTDEESSTLMYYLKFMISPVFNLSFLVLEVPILFY